jgi:carboxypeptidase family protein/TonB-dependent receptor-like protein
MQPIGGGRTVRFGAALAALLFAGGQTLAAQGVTSASVQGRITSETRGTVENAIVALTNTSTGARQQTSTNSAGRYNFENVPPGGPYTMEVRAIGFQAASKTGVMLTLGQKYMQDFELKQQVVTLEELTVVAATNPLINSGRTGPAQIVNDTSIQRLPLLGRNFTDLLRTSPQVLSGTSIAGQNNRFNTILIDGGVNNDIFGLSTSATPGGRAGAKPISLEAMQEFQILVAPFDIRQGSFSGGLVNSVTKSGTNQFHGSLFGYAQRPELVGRDTGRVRVGTFDIKQYGGTFGGPIILNKLHFFGAADIQSSQTPFFGPEATEPSTGITVATALRVQEIIKTKYGFDPGGPEAPQSLNRPDKNLFGKLNWNIGGSSGLEFSYNYTRATSDVFARANRSDPTRDGWQLSKSGYRIGNRTNTLRAKFTTLLGKANLEVLGGYQTVRDANEIPVAAPLLLIEGDVSGNYIAAGPERFNAQGNELDQDVKEITANLTFGLGRNHQITVGTHNEFFDFRNLFAANRFGTWTFGDADSLEDGLAKRYERLLEAREGGFTARFAVQQLGAYIQDAWRPTDRLTLTAGLRYDVPFSDKPVENPLPELVALGVHTGQFPSGNGLWSPRLGFNWDPRGTGNTILRGGVGLFSGRPPYVWMSNAFTNTGLEQVILTCLPPNVPAFTADVNNAPDVCANSTTSPTPPAANVNYFEKDFKFQQALKFAVGVDQRLPAGIVGTVDFLVTRNKNQMYLMDDNIVEGRVSAGEGRQLYAEPTATKSPASTGSNSVRLIQTNKVLQVVHHLNKSADRSYIFSVQLQKAFESGLQFGASYSKAKSEDLITLGSSIATSNLRFTPLDGTQADRNLRPSALDVPHKIAINGSANLPFGLQLSAIYTARAGTPYSYVYTNDANGDAISSNDLYYVPLDQNDITLTVPSTSTAQAEWDRLDAFIKSEPCLDEQRGRIMKRGSCRNPWQRFLDVRLAKIIPTLSGQSFQVTADIFNFLNLLDRDWGINRSTSFGNEQVSANTLAMSTTAYDMTNDRGVYTVPAVFSPLRRVDVTNARWRIQLGGKYIF